MFPGKEILRSAVLVAIGGIVALLVSKLLEGDEGAAAQRDMREIRGEDELNETEKQPQENDERLCWEGECGCSHIKHIEATPDLEYFKSIDFPEASYMSEKFCVNTEKRKMRAAKNCHAKIFYLVKNF